MNEIGPHGMIPSYDETPRSRAPVPTQGRGTALEELRDRVATLTEERNKLLYFQHIALRSVELSGGSGVDSLRELAQHLRTVEQKLVDYEYVIEALGYAR